MDTFKCSNSHFEVFLKRWAVVKGEKGKGKSEVRAEHCCFDSNERVVPLAN